MPKANGKHYSYTRRYGGLQYRSSGRTYTKQAANVAARNKRKQNKKARVQRLGSTDRFAIYERNGGY